MGSEPDTVRKELDILTSKQHELDTFTSNCANVGVAERIVPTSEPLINVALAPETSLPTQVIALLKSKAYTGCGRFCGDHIAIPV